MLGESQEPLPRLKRSELIVEEVKRWIVAQGLKSGDRLPQERELLKLLRSSRGTVREALKVLESQGLIEISQGAGGGAKIASVSYQRTSQFLRNYLYFQPLTWAQLYGVREKLEPMVALDVVGRLSATELAALEATIDVCRLGIAGQAEPHEHRAAELEFHAILCRACTDPILSLLSNFIVDLLRDFAEFKNVIAPRDSEFAQAALRYHVALLHAFKSGDRGEVEQLMTEHIHHAGCVVAEQESNFKGDFLLNAGSRRAQLNQMLFQDRGKA